MHDHWDMDYVNEVEAKAKQGDVDAMCRLAGLYNNQANFSASLSWYEKAAALGSAEGMRAVGDHYKFFDTKEAVKWYKKAVELGEERAAEDLAECENTLDSLAKTIGDAAVSSLTWEDASKIAQVLVTKFPHTDVPTLREHSLLVLLKESGLLGVLPALDGYFPLETQFAIKCAMMQQTEDLAVENEHQNREADIITWDDYRKIAGILNKKFQRIDVLSLTDAKLLEIMKEAGVLDKLPETPDGQEKEDALFCVKVAVSRGIEDDSDYDARQGDVYV
jgi:Fe-S-cluster formation regulator IscX/YfhJ